MNGNLTTNLVLHLLILPLTVFFLVNYIKNRKTFHFRHRCPGLVILINVGFSLLSLVYVYRILAAEFGLPFSCSIALVLFDSGFFLMYDIFLIRSFYIYKQWAFQNFNSEFDRRRSSYFLLRRYDVPILTLVVLLLHVTSVAVQYRVNDIDYSFSAGKKCYVGQEWRYAAIYFLLLVPSNLIALFLLRNVEERHHVAFELKIHHIYLLTVQFLHTSEFFYSIYNYQYAFYGSKKDLSGLMTVEKNLTITSGYYFFLAGTISIGITLGYPYYLNLRLNRKKWPDTEVWDVISLEDFLKVPKNFANIMVVAKLYLYTEYLYFWKCVRKYKDKNEVRDAKDLNAYKEFIIDEFLVPNAIRRLDADENLIKEVVEKQKISDENRVLFNELLKFVLEVILNNIYNAYLFEKNKVKKLNKK